MMHLDVLKRKNKEIFSRLHTFTSYYLGGETALALQIGHRFSDDFDLFSSKPILRTLPKNVQNVFHGRTMHVQRNSDDELTISIDGVHVTFLYYPFPVIKKFVFLKELRLLSIPEIAATKAYAIGRRGTFKDYVDLYYILKEKHITLADLIVLAKKKYQRDFTDRLFLEQLLYLEDITDVRVRFLKIRVTKHSIQHFFAKQIRELNVFQESI